MAKRITLAIGMLLLVAAMIVPMTVTQVSAATASPVQGTNVAFSGSADGTCCYCTFMPTGSGNPSKAYTMRMDFMVYGTVSGGKDPQIDIQFQTYVGGTETTFFSGYRFGSNSHFYVEGGGVNSRTAATLTTNKYYSFVWKVNSSGVTLYVNGVNVASRSVSIGSYGYIIFYPKSVNMDILCTDFQYDDGSAHVFLTGQRSMGAPYWDHPSSFYQYPTRNVTYSLAKMIEAGGRLYTVITGSNQIKYSAERITNGNNTSPNCSYSLIFVDGTHQTGFNATMNFVPPASIGNTNNAYICFIESGVAAGYRYRDNKFFIANGVDSYGNDGLYADKANGLVLSSSAYTLDSEHIYNLDVRYDSSAVYVYFNGELVVSKTSGVSYSSGNYAGLGIYAPCMNGVDIVYKCYGNRTQNSVNNPISGLGRNAGCSAANNQTRGSTSVAYATATSAYNTAYNNLDSTEKTYFSEGKAAFDGDALRRSIADANLGTPKYMDGTTSFSASGVTATCTGVAGDYSNFKAGSVEAFAMNSTFTFRLSFSGYSANSNSFWVISIPTYAIGYDFAHSCFGIQSGGIAASSSSFDPSIKSRTFNLTANRFYDVKVEIFSDHIAVYVDNECLIYTTQAKRDGTQWLISYPKNVTIQYAMIDWDCGGNHYMNNLTGSNLQGSANWARGASYSNGSYSGKTIAADSGPTISSYKSTYSGLSAFGKVAVTNYSTLSTADTTYSGLVSARSAINTAIVNADVAIDAIGNVSVNSGNALTNAKNKYDLVDSSFRSDVWNYSDYTSKKADYDAFYPVYTAIAALPSVANTQLSDGTAITNAYNSYTALTDARKAKVTNSSTLTNVRDEYLAIKGVYDDIVAIGSVTTSSGSKITTAEGSYAALSTSTRKAKITNYTTLTNSRTAYNALTAAAAYTVANVTPTSSGVVTAYNNLNGLASGPKGTIATSYYDTALTNISNAKAEYDKINPIYTTITGLPAASTITLATNMSTINSTYTSFHSGTYTDAQRAKINTACGAETIDAKKSAYDDRIPTVYMTGTPDSSKIKANVYFLLTDGESLSNISVTVDGVTKTLNAAGVTSTKTGAPSGKTYYILSTTRPAKQMTDSFAYSISGYDTTYQSGTTTVAYYCNQLLSYTGNKQAEVRAVAQAMLNYGRAAQVYFKYPQANPTAAQLPANSSTPSATVSGTKFNSAPLAALTNNVDSCPVAYSAINVTFKDDTTLYIAFRVKDDSTETSREYAFNWVKNNISFGGKTGENLNAVLEEGQNKLYWFVIVSIKNIPIKDIEEPQAIKVNNADGGSLTVMNYIVVAQKSTNADLKALTQGLLNYYNAIKALTA